MLGEGDQDLSFSVEEAIQPAYNVGRDDLDISLSVEGAIQPAYHVGADDQDISLSVEGAIQPAYHVGAGDQDIPFSGEGAIQPAYHVGAGDLDISLSVEVAIQSAYPVGADDLDISSSVEGAIQPAYHVGADVFLSHSGVEKNFVRQLYKDLTRDGVSCFFDQSLDCLPLAEMWAPRIFESAETCSVAVLLLSMDFIKSRWPMLELSAFFKAKKSGKNSNLKILPLFFKISPTDLKDFTKDIQDIPAWTRLEISEEMRIEWKEALREVRKINGLQFKEGEDEVSFRDKIIKKIRALLPPSPRIFDSSMLVGLADVPEEVIALLQLTSEDPPRMAVAIYGFGGIGKTTLAEAVIAKINLEPYRYARVNFNIHPAKNDIRKMQEQILNDLFPKSTKQSSQIPAKVALL